MREDARLQTTTTLQAAQDSGFVCVEIWADRGLTLPYSNAKQKLVSRVGIELCICEVSAFSFLTPSGDVVVTTPPHAYVS